MKTPIKISKHLVSKAPFELKPKMHKNNQYTVREITIRDIKEDPWLKKRRKAFEKMLNDGHIILIVINENTECVAYGCVAVGKAKPSHLPRIPNGSAWLHYTRVRENYRSLGLHRLLIEERIKITRERYGQINIYTDTSENNIPSRINQLKLGFTDCGIYYTLEIGTRRIPFLHLLLGVWIKNKKHPEILKNK